MKRQRILSELDLEPIIIKTMDAEEGYGWTFDFARQVSGEYRKFLILCLENPDTPIVPSSVIDDFWHLHILDTQKYMEDCERYFGYMLHHFPYFGMRGQEDADNLRRAWSDTLALYLSTFGEMAPADLWPKSNRCPNCGRRCRRGNTSSVFNDSRPSFADMGLAI